MEMTREAAAQVNEHARFARAEPCAEPEAGVRLFGVPVLGGYNPLGRGFAYSLQRRMSSRSEAP
jgi:hypothetical protein